MTFRQAAAMMSVSPATAHRWWHRYADALLAERHSLAWAVDRTSRPHRSPRLLDAGAQERICEVRRDTGWGPRLVAGVTGHPHSTVWKVLRRHGQSRRPSMPREAANRYEWPCPGDLLHIDVKTYPRFDTPGHAVTGDRSRPGKTAASISARTTLTRPSMITRGWRSVSSTQMSALAQPSRSSNVLSSSTAATGSRSSGFSRTTLGATRTTGHSPSCSSAKASSTNDSSLSSTHEREGGALPPDDGARVGLRPHLRQLQPSSRCPATLA
jgi:transposase